MNQEKIGNLIRKLRNDNNLSQKEFADKYGVTYQAVSKWENGKNMPDIVLLKQICDDYSLDINMLLGGQARKRHSINRLLIVLIIIAIVVGFSIWRITSTSSDSVTLSNISSACEDFVVTGSVAYSSKKGVVSITGVNYCGQVFDQEYDKIECVLYETSDGTTQELGKVESTSRSDLKSFLNGVKFNISNYVKTCKKYDDNNLYLEIGLYNGEETVTRHKVNLRLNEICDGNV